MPALPPVTPFLLTPDRLHQFQIGGALWLFWLLCWLAAAFTAKTTRWQESIGSRLTHTLPLLVSAFLLAAPRHLPHVLNHRLFVSDTAGWIGVALIAFGVAFSLWARWHLGRNWSGTITLKQDHALIRTGPYRRIRHPIYTGMLIALFGTFIQIGEWRSLLAFVIATAGLVYKLGLEEARMGETFPEYAEYRHSSYALLPFVY